MSSKRRKMVGRRHIRKIVKMVKRNQSDHSRYKTKAMTHIYTWCYLMSMVKRLLLVTKFWSGPLRVTEGLGRPQTLQQSTTVSPNAHTTSDSGTRNSGATGHKKHIYRPFSSYSNIYHFQKALST